MYQLRLGVNSFVFSLGCLMENNLQKFFKKLMTVIGMHLKRSQQQR